MDFGLEFQGADSPTLDQLMLQLETGEAYEDEGEFVVADTDPVKLIKCFEGNGVEDKSLKYLLMNMVSMLLPREERKVQKISGVEVAMPLRISGKELKFCLNSLRNFTNAADTDILSQLEEGGVIPLLSVTDEPEFYIKDQNMEIPVYLSGVDVANPPPGSVAEASAAEYFGICFAEACDQVLVHTYTFTDDPANKLPLNAIKDSELAALGRHGCVRSLVITRAIQTRNGKMREKPLFIKDGKALQPVSHEEFLFLECKMSSTRSVASANHHRRIRFVTGGMTYYLSGILSWLLMLNVRSRTKFGKRDCDRVKVLERYRGVVGDLSATDARREFERVQASDEPFKSDKLAMLTRRVADISYKKNTLKKYEVTRTREIDPLEEHVKARSTAQIVKTCHECKRDFYHLACVHCGIGLDYHGRCLYCVGTLLTRQEYYPPIPRKGGPGTGPRKPQPK